MRFIFFFNSSNRPLIHQALIKRCDKSLNTLPSHKRTPPPILYFPPYTPEPAMAPRKELSPQLRARITELRSAQWSYGRIAKKHKISRSTVITTCKREAIRKENASCTRSGRPRKIDEVTRDLLYDEAVNNTARVTWDELTAKAVEWCGQDVKKRSVQRLFKQMVNDKGRTVGSTNEA